MGLGYGIVAAAASLGLEAILIKPKRSIGPFEAYVTISERHTDELEIVDHPIEFGANVTDHVFKRPPEVVIECAWSNSPRPKGLPLIGSAVQAVTGTIAGVQSIISGNSPDQVKDIYSRLVKLQESAELVTVVTGKRTYEDMLIRSLMVETDKDTEHVLRVTATLRQILIVHTLETSISAPTEAHADPQTTAPVTEQGNKQLGAEATPIPNSVTDTFNLPPVGSGRELQQ